MLIIIREKKTAAAKHYILREPKSGLEREWIPPKGIAPGEIEESLDSVAEIFAKEVEEKTNQSPCPDYSDSVDLKTLQGMNFRQFGSYFMYRKCVDLAEYTRNNWEGCLKTRIYPWFGMMSLRDITPADIEDFLTALKKEGLKNSTVIKYYTVLKSIFKEAFKRNAISENPMNRVERPKPRKDEVVIESPHAYPPEQIRHIIECLYPEPTKWQVFILLLADTGIRRGECCALRWEDFDFAQNTVSIQYEVGHTADKGVYITTPKNRKQRTLDVDPDIMLYVRFYYLEMLASKKGLSTYLFPHRNDHTKPMLPCSATSYFAKFGKKYGVDNMNPHRLRHSYASVAITNGADIASVSEVLGHSDKAFTLRQYTQSNPVSMKKASAIRRQAIKQSHTENNPSCQIEQTRIIGF